MAVDCIANTAINHSPPSPPPPREEKFAFDASVLQFESNIPKQFVWPDEEKPAPDAKELPVPLIDLGGFLSGDPIASNEASRLVADACLKHGFFLVGNHGVDPSLLADALRYMDFFFNMPLSEKQGAQRKPGEHCGYASSFTGRFSTKLPWKETFSFRFSDEVQPSSTVEDYILAVMGENFRKFG